METQTRSWNATKLQLSPASLPPNWSPHPGGGGGGGEGENTHHLNLTGDKHYFMHGEIIAFTAISIFVIFLLFLIVPLIRRPASLPSGAVAAEESRSGKKKNWLLVMLRTRRYELPEEITSGRAPSDDKNHGFQQHRIP